MSTWGLGMLISFKIKNFKSYRQEAEFSMKAERINGLKYSLLNYKVGNKSKDADKKALCSSVIYGPNASGKSNIIKALYELKEIISRGNIKLNNLELLPNVQSSQDETTDFEIEFYNNNLLFRYYLSLDIGGFINKHVSQKVKQETLFVNNKMTFERNDTELKVNYNDAFLKSYINEGINSHILDILENGIISTDLFLTNGFKNISTELAQDVIEWFEKKVKILNDMHNLNMMPISNERFINDKFTNEIAKESGMTGHSLVYTREDDKGYVLRSLVNKYLIASEDFESFGTQRIVKIMPIILTALKFGSVLLVDELDVALHPKVIMNIINLFHNDEINTQNAQLIFNTHNPIYLNSAIFRRDEIKFVEKDKDNNSIIYKLSDFGTTGKNSVRTSTNYIKNYFMDRYGAILNIDYSQIFKKALKGDEGDDK